MELLAKYLQQKFAALEIWIWHLDHWKKHHDRRRKIWNLEYLDGLSQDREEEFLEYPLVCAWEAHQEQHVQLLHDQF